MIVSSQYSSSLLSVVGGKAPPMPLLDWYDVLRLAGKWHMADLRSTAFEELTHLWIEDTAVMQLIAASQFDVREWVLPAVSFLSLRESTLSVKEMEKLTLAVAHKVLVVRDTHLKQSARYSGTSRLCGHSKAQVEELFG
jgi:hypothetical protein